jgi:hypothetical protein
VKRERRAHLQRAALRECAEIIESAIGCDLGIYSEFAIGPEESEVIETTMRRVSDALYARAEKKS